MKKIAGNISFTYTLYACDHLLYWRKSCVAISGGASANSQNTKRNVGNRTEETVREPIPSEEKAESKTPSGFAWSEKLEQDIVNSMDGLIKSKGNSAVSR